MAGLSLVPLTCVPSRMRSSRVHARRVFHPFRRSALLALGSLRPAFFSLDSQLALTHLVPALLGLVTQAHLSHRRAPVQVLLMLYRLTWLIAYVLYPLLPLPFYRIARLIATLSGFPAAARIVGPRSFLQKWPSRGLHSSSPTHTGSRPS